MAPIEVGVAVGDVDAAVVVPVDLGLVGRTVEAAVVQERVLRAVAVGVVLAELDVNPIIVRPAGAGVAAVDALIRLAKGN